MTLRQIARSNATPARIGRANYDASTATRQVSPTLFGLFFEDINYACDGGLTANLVNNYGFDAVYTARHPLSPLLASLRRKPLPRRPDRTRHWTVRGGTLSSADDNPIVAGSFFGRVSTATKALLQNRGYGAAMPLRGGVAHRVTITARSDQGVGLEARLIGAGGRVVDSAPLGQPGPSWTPMEGHLTSAVDLDGVLQIVVTGPGVVDLNDVTFVPVDHWGAGDPRWSQGLLRRDIVEALRALRPTFMRFPGGCIVEGAGEGNGYNWKRSVGPLQTRRGDYNLWGIQIPHGDYTQSLQIGFYEYFLLCEDLGMEPVPVVSAGLSCQIRGSEVLPIEGEEMAQAVQDVLDLIDWATGDPQTSQWAALRATSGHPDPFPLRYLAIGNENWGPDYLQRFDLIASAVRSRHPEVTPILSAGARPRGKSFDRAWHHARSAAPHAVVDEHFYANPPWFKEAAHRYDDYPREGPKVFIGEYAANSPVPSPRRVANSTASALAEAAFLTGVERNSDVIAMTSYAPLLNVVGHSQWRHNLIDVLPRGVSLTPNYVVQEIFGSCSGKYIVDGLTDLPPGVVTSSVAGDTDQWVKVVNTTKESAAIEIELPQAGDGPATVTMLHLPDDPRTRGRAEVLRRRINTVDTGGLVAMDVPAHTLVVVHVALSRGGPEPGHLPSASAIDAGVPLEPTPHT